MRHLRYALLGLLVMAALFVGPVPVAQAATFTVDSTGDAVDANPGNGTCATAGAVCTLRAAIEEANALTGTDTINFSIPGAGPHTIQPNAALPTITDPVLIDGYTEPGASANTNATSSGLGSNAVLMIELDGSNAGASVEGLTILAGGSTVEGLAINRFAEDGIELVGGGVNVIRGNFIGTDVTGNVNLGNTLRGVRLQNDSLNTIGGTAAADRNVISGNAIGIEIGATSSGNDVLGNLIGTDAAGTVGLGNSGSGIVIRDNSTDNNTIGGATAAARNVISSNGQSGIVIAFGASGNDVQGNYIGTQVDGTSALGNAVFGIGINDSATNTVGGTATGEGNTIAFNDFGMRLEGSSATGNSIRGNSIHSNSVVGIINVAGANVGLTPPTVTSAGSASGTACANCAIDVFSDDDDEGRIYHGSTTADGSGNWSFLGAVTGPNITATNTDASGNTSEFSAPYLPGFTVNSSDDADDGSCDASHCSLREAINSSNTLVGTNTINFNIPGAGPHTIQPASILPSISDPVTIDGYTQPGASVNTNGPALGNNAVLKVELDGTSAGTAVGFFITAGSSTVRGLAIHSFSGPGIRSQTNGGNTIEGNFIGTDVTGTVNLGNSSGGVNMITPNNVIGGTTPAARNVISGNSGFGVVIGGLGNQVIGNFIGTDVTGTVDIGNLSGGVRSANANTIIGGTTPAARNVISGNGGSGVDIVFSGATNNLVQGNFIGTQLDDVSPLGNSLNGVVVSSSANNNTIGGIASGAGNTIAYNTRGVRVVGASATGNEIRGNSIHSNSLEGIQNASGGNTELAPPVITAAGSASGTACLNCTVDVYSDDAGEGRVYHGSTVADGSGNWSFSGAVIGPDVTATATDGGGNTSEERRPGRATSSPATPPASSSAAAWQRGTRWRATS